MARLTTINNAGNQITQINQFTPTSMSCNDFLFNPNKRGIWESSYLFLSEEHQALISALSVQQGRKKKKRKKKRLSQYTLYRRGISHTDMPYGRQMIATKTAIKVGVTAAVSL